MTTPVKRVNVPKVVKEYIYARDNNRCRYCECRVYPCNGDKGPWRELDHITPVFHGGTNDPANLVLACGQCNGKAGYRLFESFDDKREWILNQYAHSRNLLASYRMYRSQEKRIVDIRLTVYDLKTITLLYGSEHGEKFYRAVHDLGYTVEQAAEYTERAIIIRRNLRQTDVLTTREALETTADLMQAGYTYYEIIDELERTIGRSCLK